MDGGFIYASAAVSDRQRDFVQARLRQRLVERNITGDRQQRQQQQRQQQRQRQQQQQYIDESSTAANGLQQGVDKHSSQSRRASAVAVVPRRPDRASEMDSAAVQTQQRQDSFNDTADARTDSTPSSSSGSQRSDRVSRNDPFELRHGRRYLRDVPYPLPCDLAELQRQNLRTLLACTAFGRAVCSPAAVQNPPRRVLELGCGAAYWTLRCHDFFARMGYRDLAFTGLDVAPLAPDLRRQGVDWTFVRHDLRRRPWPFDDADFDLVICKDLSLAVPLGQPSQAFLDECIRVLRPGGTLEIWESDHALRSLLPNPAPPASAHEWEQDMAVHTGTFLIAPGTPFSPVRNKYLKAANAWIGEALDLRHLPPAPCARLSQVLYQEPDALCDIGSRRIAVPLGELSWEREHGRRPSRSKGKTASPSSSTTTSSSSSSSRLTAEQRSLRQTALLTVVQMIEGLEPMLRQASGKNSEEWSYWWGLMMADLMDPSKRSLTGECLEIGAWWATKLDDHDD